MIIADYFKRLYFPVRSGHRSRSSCWRVGGPWPLGLVGLSSSTEIDRIRENRNIRIGKPCLLPTSIRRIRLA